MKTRDEALQSKADEHHFPLDAPIKTGGIYVPVLIDGDTAYIAGQIPRVGDEIRHIGTVGESISLETAQRAAALSALRALTLIKQACGSLDAIRAVPRITVFVRSAPGFTEQSEVADGASRLLHQILGEAGVHTRTSVGVLQLPKGACVEVDFSFKISSVGRP